MYNLYIVFEMIQVLELQRLPTVLGMAVRDLLRAAKFLHILPVEMIIYDYRLVVPKRTLFVRLSLIPNIT